MGIDRPQQPSTTKGRFQSAVKYSDKPRLARFRDFAENFFDKRGLNATMESLIGNVVLDKKLQQRAALERDESERRGWEQEHWRPTGAGRDGVRRDGGACGDGPATDANGGEGSKRRKTQEDSRSGGGTSTTETSGRSHGVNCGAAAPDVTTTDYTLRSMIDDAMEFLDSMAHDVDLAFGQTHGGATRVRDKSNPDRFGNGHSAEAKRISLECKKLRRVVRFVHKKQLDKASQLCVTLAADGIELPDVHEDESAVIDSATSILKRKRLELQGRNRAQLILNSGGSSAKSQENKQRAATKRDVNAVMERSVRGAVASVTVGAGDAAEVLTDPLEVARECCEWSDRRMSLMQPKWFRRLDVAVGHAVWVADGAKVIGGLVHAIDNDGHYTVKPDTGALLFGVRRETLCLKWQVGSSLGAAAAATRGAHVDGDSRRRSNGVVNDEGLNIGSTAVPKAADVSRLAAMDRSRVDDTALLFRKGEAGRRCRARAVKGELTQDDITQLPSCFHELLEDLQSPVSGRTGATVQSSDFANMVDELGAPRPITSAIMRRKLGKIAKGKAPGFSGNGPDLYASLPDSWVEWAVELANIIQFTQITPRAWHIDLVHYVHKGGSDGSLSNHRPLALVAVFCPPRSTGRRRSTLACCARPSAAGPVVNL